MRILYKNTLWVLTLTLFNGASLYASTLELTNGDRITGIFIKEENGTIFFGSDILGQISVNNTQGKIISPKKSSEEQKKTEATTQLESVTETENAKAEKDSKSTKILKWPSLNTMFLDAPPGKKLDSRINAGYRLGEGERNQQDINIALNIRHDTKKNQYFIDSSYDYSFQKINGLKIVNRERYNTGFRWRRDMSKRLFSQFDSAYVKDLVKEIDDDFKQSLGIGWRVFDKKSFELSITPALSGRYQNIPTVTEDWELLGSFFQDVRYKISDQITFYQESDISFDPANTDSLTIEFLTRLEAQISNRLYANLRYEIDYDNNLPTGVEKAQERIILGMGYKF